MPIGCELCNSSHAKQTQQRTYADVTQQRSVDEATARTWLSSVSDLNVTSTIMSWWMRCAFGCALTTMTLHRTVATTNSTNMICSRQQDVSNLHPVMILGRPVPGAF